MKVVKVAPLKSSKPLRSMKPVKVDPSALSAVRTFQDRRLIIPKTRQNTSGKSLDTSIVQNAPSLLSAMPPATANFEGVNNVSGVLPPDTQGDIGWDPATGKKYYVQWVNLAFQIWDVTTPAEPLPLLASPAAGNTLWAGTGTLCEDNNDGDPLTRFDALSNRWVMSQFALSFPDDFHQCIAVSQTADPTGAWYLYDFQTSTSLMNDYGKIGIWSDGYYMSFNQFDGSSDDWKGAGVAVFERDKMLLGQAARMIYIDTGAVTLDYGGILPSDLDGPAPPAGTPNYFMEWDDSAVLGDTFDTLRVWEFKTDWNNPANTTFGLNADYDPTLKIATANVDPRMCGGLIGCIPQPGTTAKLDAITDGLMYRLQYRNFGAHQTIVGNHTVDATGADKAGIHWFELRNSGGAGFVMHQEGVYAPDSDNRWMGSVAMDASGNMALGYSVASAATFPSVRYSGRLSGDPPGTLPQGEETLVAGGGSQTSSSARWGDYSMMAVDSSDGCTFWYTQEYMQTTSKSSWQTRIGSFKFPSCTTTSTGILSGSVADSASAAVAGVTIGISPGGYSTVTDAAGHYSIPLASGTYTVTASKYGYLSDTVPGVVIAAPGTTVQNFSLTTAQPYTISGVVSDVTAGWPLYARINIAGYPGSPVFTNPVTGAYSVNLPHNTYTYTVTAMSGGYKATSQPVFVTADATQDIGLAVDTVTCSAPGYYVNVTCVPIAAGGLVIGAVKDANTGALIANATIQDASHTYAAMIDSAADKAVPAKLYVIGQAAGIRPLTATALAYGTGSVSPIVIAGGTVGQDISLSAGQLTATPTSLTFDLTTAIPTASLPLNLDNSGGIAARYDIFTVPGTFAGYAPHGPFADNTRHAGPMALNDNDTANLRVDITPNGVTPLAAGGVSTSWATGLTFPWGIGFNTDAGDLWLGNIKTGGGDDLDYRFTTAGVKTGDTIDTTPWVGSWGGDLTYNPFTKTLWQVNVGGDNCIYELDPATKTSTGNKICPAFGTSQRGLAFDPLTNTYYSGSWNDFIINHFAPDGTILDSKAVGLRISGLAFNPSTGHLFVMTNAATTSDPTKLDVYVLDTKNSYANLGGFNLKNGGANAFADKKQAGLELDCSGNLWAVDQGAGKVHMAASGETGVCAWQETGWLSVTPSSGSVAAGGTAALTVSADTTGLVPGTYNAYLRVANNSPYGPLIVPVTVNVKPTVTYNGNGSSGGTVPAEPAAYLLGATVTVLGNSGSLTKTGYSFAGWNTLADGSGTNYATADTFVIGAANVTLYATWTINRYTVSFNSDGGSAVSSQLLVYNTYAAAPTAPTRTGYTFAGWYSDSALSTLFVFATTPITADITLYATWTINSYTVSFNSDGGSLVASRSLVYNTYATTPTAPTRTGYTFAGWCSDSALSTLFVFATTPITADITLYAKWTINSYSVTPSAGTGSIISPNTPQSVIHGLTTSFTVTAGAGYGILSVNGCNGTLSGSMYTTGAITGNCSVSSTAVKHSGNGGSNSGPTIADALKALQSYYGIVTLTPVESILYDVAPISADGVPQGDGVVDIADVIMIMRRIVGIGNW